MESRYILKRGYFVWLLLVFSMFLPIEALSSSITLQSMQIKDDQLLLNFNSPIPSKGFQPFILKSPKSYRYVFDMPNIHLASRSMAKKLNYNHLKIKSIRISQYRRNTVRLVIETPRAYTIIHRINTPEEYLILLPEGSCSIDTSKDLENASRNTQNRQSFKPIKSNTINIFNSGKNEDNSVMRITIPSTDENQNISSNINIKNNTNRNNVVSNSYLMDRKNLQGHRGYRIIVDPGHGGHDSGAIDPSGHYKEKDAVLQIALKLRKHLKELGFDVVMTRTSDNFIKLHRRTRFANFKHGDIFVSVHANAVSRLRRARVVHGIETYFLSPARSARAKRVATKENSVGFTRYYKNSMSSFLNTLTRSKIILSNKLAIDVQKSILKNLRSEYRGVVDGGVRPAPFWVLVGAEMPAILVETGYITHPVEKKRLFDPVYQDLEALGIAEGIARYLINREKELQ